MGISARRAPSPVHDVARDIDTHPAAPADTLEDFPSTLPDLLRQHGYNSNSFLWRYPGYNFFAESGLLAYIERGNAVIAAGDPLCHIDDAGACLDAFRDWCASRGRYA